MFFKSKKRIKKIENEKVKIELKQKLERENLKDLILSSNFSEAMTITENLDLSLLNRYIIEIGGITENIIILDFVDYLMKHSRISMAELHSIKADLYSCEFAYLENSYLIAFEQVKQAINLQPDNMSYWKQILLFYDIPDRLLSKQNALAYCEKILEKEPEFFAAKKIYEEITEFKNN